MRCFFMLSCIVACAGQGANPACPVHLNPPSPVVRYGDPMLLNCSSPSDQIESVGIESVYGSVMSTAGESSVILDVKSMIHWNFRPICFLNRLTGGQCSQIFPVTIYKMPDVVSITRPSLQGPLVEGQRYSIQCEVANVAPIKNLLVHWHKGDTILRTEKFTDLSRSEVNTTSVLNLTAQRGDDGARIWCEAQLHFRAQVLNLTTMKSESYHVTVLYSPAFTEPKNETLELSAGSKLILDCDAAGNPMPEYSWRFPHAIQQQPTQNENLSVLAPSIQLPGTYECTASNSQGSETKYFTVTEATRDRTTLAALVGGVVLLGVVIAAVGLLTLTPQGTFSFSKGGYLKGQPTSPGPI